MTTQEPNDNNVFGPVPPVDKPPRPVIEFKLTIGAESFERLGQALEQLAFEILCEKARGPSGCWGGAGSNGHYTIDHDPNLTPEQYRSDLQAWAARQRARREAGAQEGTPPAAGAAGNAGTS